MSGKAIDHAARNDGPVLFGNETLFFPGEHRGYSPRDGAWRLKYNCRMLKIRRVERFDYPGRCMSGRLRGSASGTGSPETGAAVRGNRHNRE
jgi:hypothetical protein